MNTIDWAGELLDTAVSLSGKYGRWLNAKGKKTCFIIWSICTIYWAFRDFNLGLYSQTIFCIFSVGLNFYGYIHWKKRDSQLNNIAFKNPVRKKEKMSN